MSICHTYMFIHIHTFTQMRKAGRTDLISALSRYGGSDVVAKRFKMLPSTEYAYHCEFLELLKELRGTCVCVCVFMSMYICLYAYHCEVLALLKENKRYIFASVCIHTHSYVCKLAYTDISWVYGTIGVEYMCTRIHTHRWTYIYTHIQGIWIGWGLGRFPH